MTVCTAATTCMEIKMQVSIAILGPIGREYKLLNTTVGGMEVSMEQNGILIVISGFSGAGKGTLVRGLLNKYGNYVLSVSMTTRPPREGERDGIEYFFTDKDHFEETIEQNGLIEYASYCGNYYGTPRVYVEDQMANGKDVILEIEIQGALKIKEKFPESLLIFVTAPDAQELMRRLKKRGTESEEMVARRLARAVEESEGIESYDYIVVNDDVETCVDEIHRLVDAARRATVRRAALISEIREELKSFAKGEL